MQLEWTLLGLIGFSVYIFVVGRGAVSLLAVISALIILNGWISSRATSTIYSDLLLAIDVVIVAIYFGLTLTLHLSGDHLSASFWLFSAALCFAYLLWNLALIPLFPEPEKKRWRNRFGPYVVIMALSATFFVALHFLHVNSPVGEFSVAIAGSILWIAVLAKWHYDKLRSK